MLNHRTQWVGLWRDSHLNLNKYKRLNVYPKEDGGVTWRVADVCQTQTQGYFRVMDTKSQVLYEVKGSPSLPRKCFTELTPSSIKLEHFSQMNNGAMYLFVPFAVQWWNCAQHFSSRDFQLLLCCVNISISMCHATWKCQSQAEFIKVLLNNFLFRYLIITKFSIKINLYGVSFGLWFFVKMAVVIIILVVCGLLFSVQLSIKMETLPCRFNAKKTTKGPKIKWLSYRGI